MLEGINKVHLIGIGGIGVSAVAKYLRAQQITVSGSDVHASEITKELEAKGIQVFVGHDSINVSDQVGLVIYSSAIPESNVERVKAVDLGVRQLSYAEFLGELSKTFSTIVVTGTHGKSTTTAMLALILEEAGYDPTVIVGSRVPSFPEGNLRVGAGRFFVVEGCEYKANMLQLHPEMIVLTNIEEEHLDYYRDLDHIKETFQEFVNGLKGRGQVIWNADDAVSQQLTVTRGTTFGMKEKAEYVMTKRETSPGAQKMAVSRMNAQEEILGKINLVVPGEYNAMNALAATAAAMELGVPFETCLRVLEKFKGIWRRFERLGTWKDAELISDYGHHPTEIEATIEAAREFFPERRLVLCLQPHQHARTISLREELVEAVQGADVVILTEIYEVSGRTEEKQVSSQELVEQVKKENPKIPIVYAEDLESAEHQLTNLVQPDDVVIIQGAGDIDALARTLIS